MKTGVEAERKKSDSMPVVFKPARDFCLSDNMNPTYTYLHVYKAVG